VFRSEHNSGDKGIGETRPVTLEHGEATS